jgi:transglutaminase-like putative cysteine protease
MRWINSEFAYEPRVTDAKNHLEQAFTLSKGFCQDFAHVMLGMCRSLEIAVGRNYQDVEPIHGSFKRNAECFMNVEVVVKRL